MAILLSLSLTQKFWLKLLASIIKSKAEYAILDKALEYELLQLWTKSISAIGSKSAACLTISNILTCNLSINMQFHLNYLL